VIKAGKRNLSPYDTTGHLWTYSGWRGRGVIGGFTPLLNLSPFFDSFTRKGDIRGTVYQDKNKPWRGGMPGRFPPSGVGARARE